MSKNFSGEEYPSYYAITPACVRYDEELSPNAKLLYGEITALCNKNGYCWASNNYFAKLYKVSKRSIINWISLLVKKGYLQSYIEYKENSKEVLNRYLKIIIPTDEKIFTTPNEKIFTTPNEKIFTDNNTRKNITSNNIYFDETQNFEKDKKQEKKENNQKLENDFLELWELYGKVGSKAEAMKSFLTAVRDTPVEKIREGIEKYNLFIENEQKTFPERQKKDFTRWLKYKGWNDENKIKKIDLKNDNESKTEMTEQDIKRINYYNNKKTNINKPKQEETLLIKEEDKIQSEKLKDRFCDVLKNDFEIQRVKIWVKDCFFKIENTSLVIYSQDRSTKEWIERNFIDFFIKNVKNEKINNVVVKVVCFIY